MQADNLVNVIDRCPSAVEQLLPKMSVLALTQPKVYDEPLPPTKDSGALCTHPLE